MGRMARFERIVILTGAGISAESGISTFRDKVRKKLRLTQDTETLYDLRLE